MMAGKKRNCLHRVLGREVPVDDSRLGIAGGPWVMSQVAF